MSLRFVPIGGKSFLNERMNSLHHLGELIALPFNEDDGLGLNEWHEGKPFVFEDIFRCDYKKSYICVG